MRAFRKDFIREITKNKGRFLSVFFIVLLGAAFFLGHPVGGRRYESLSGPVL